MKTLLQELLVGIGIVIACIAFITAPAVIVGARAAKIAERAKNAVGGGSGGGPGGGDTTLDPGRSG